MIMKQSIKFEIELDEKSLPVNIKMSTTDSKDSIDKIIKSDVDFEIPKIYVFYLLSFL